MEENYTDVFVNVAIELALSKYEILKETNDYSIANDFLVYVAGMLAFIYGEENILGLYEKKDEQSFLYLLKKYDVDPYYSDHFIDDVEKFYKIEFKNKALNTYEYNPYFIYIQEDLINMFIAKYEQKKLDKSKLAKFKDMLFTPVSNDGFVVSYNRKMARDESYILNYYDAKVYGLLNKLDFSLKRDNVLSYEVYEAFDLTRDKLNKLSFKQIQAINNKIFNYFNVSPIEPNANKKILDAIRKVDSKELNKKNIGSNSKMPIIMEVVILILVIIILIVVLKKVGVF